MTPTLFTFTSAGTQTSTTGGNDVLYGQSGDDWLHGGAGTDYLDGGADNNAAVQTTGEAANDALFVQRKAA